MAQTDLDCYKCVGRRTVNNIVIKAKSKVMVTTVPPDRPLACTRRPIFVSANVHHVTAFGENHDKSPFVAPPWYLRLRVRPMTEKFSITVTLKNG
jgi:hypothetical protein